MTIALIDCNSFYCSCETAFRPDLEGRPAIVLSNNDGCVVARNKEAKRLQINMAQPFFQIKSIIEKHKVAYFSSNYALYADLSSRVMQTLSEFSPEMEVYSIDEAFVNLEGFNHFDLNLYGKAIKQKVFKDVHIPVSVGIAPTKVLAKIANHIAKKSEKSQGVVDLTHQKFHDRALEMVAVEDIWGIGRRSASKLRALGLKTAKDFRDYKNEKLILKLFTKTGLQIKHELQGTRCIPIEIFAKKKKQIISSKSFGKPVFELKELNEAVATYITTAAEKLRAQNSITNQLSVYIRTNPYKETQQYFNIASHHFEVGTSDTRKIITAGLDLLEKIYRSGFEYKKAGIVLNEISNKSEVQMDLFEKGDCDSSESLMDTMDLINKINGRGTLKSAACGVESKWQMARDFQSPCYTTRWSDVLKVK